MKMGEIRFSPMTERFYLMTPAGERPVTLRCTEAGVVMVEEVVGGGLSLQPLRIQTVEPTKSSPLSEISAAVDRVQETKRRMTD